MDLDAIRTGCFRNVRISSNVIKIETLTLVLQEFLKKVEENKFESYIL